MVVIIGTSWFGEKESAVNILLGIHIVCIVGNNMNLPDLFSYTHK